MSRSDDVVRVAMPCTGLGRQRRGFEAFTREARAVLHGASGIQLEVFGGGGDLEPGEQAVWNLPRASAQGRAVGRLLRWDPYFVEQASFFAAFVPRLMRWRPHLVYFADLNLGNACWHWRRFSGQSFRLLYYNGGATTQPFTRCDFVQQLTPAHYAHAVNRGESPERMFVLPHGLALPRRLPARDASRIAATRRALGVPEGRSMLLSVGILGAQLKRMHTLVAAVATMQPRPYLVLLGEETPETPALRAQARVLGDDVFIGTWPRERMPEAYLAADAFALLSLEEGFGLAYVEAMAAGLPCVAHESAHTRHIFGELAFLGDTTSPADVAALLRRALTDDGGDAARGARHEWIYERFSWETLAPRYAEMLRACAAGTPPAGGTP